MVDWFVDREWFFGRAIHRSSGFTGLLIASGLLVEQFTARAIHWPSGLLVGQPTGRAVCWPNNLLVEWFVGRVVCWSSDLLVEWFAGRAICCSSGLRVEQPVGHDWKAMIVVMIGKQCACEPMGGWGGGLDMGQRASLKDSD